MPLPSQTHGWSQQVSPGGLGHRVLSRSTTVSVGVARRSGPGLLAGNLPGVPLLQGLRSTCGRLALGPALLSCSCGLCSDDPPPPALSHPRSCDKTPWGVDLRGSLPCSQSQSRWVRSCLSDLSGASLTNVTWWLPSPFTITQPGGIQRAATVGLAYLSEHLVSSIYQAVWLRAPPAHRPTIHVWMRIPCAVGGDPRKAVLVFLRCVWVPAFTHQRQ